ncbi:MAG: type III pantothenate kinase [Chlorobi bacterium]|nr:type III pantothenate kinase [Chlorobiota bacterium]
MNLIIDIGNSYSKLSIYRGKTSFHLSSIKSNEHKLLISKIKQLKKQKQIIKNVILSSVSSEHAELEDYLLNNFDFFIKLNHETKIPIKNLYKTPKTLGKDRLAAVVAANNIFPNTNVLVFDAGTALTIDFINENAEYIGGSISPGIEMRFKALNYFTKKLPKFNLNTDFDKSFGATTEEAIISGVQNGILNEVEGYINKYSKKYKNLEIIFTGGDTFFFKERLTKKILTDPDIVMKGLNIILEHNAK